MGLLQNLKSKIGRGLAKLGHYLVGSGLPSARATDDSGGGWGGLLAGGGPADRDWASVREDQLDALEAWRRNFLVRQIVRLTHSFVVSDGITVTSEVPRVEKFLKAFWDHPENKMKSRLVAWCDELTRAGELFPVLFTNRIDGMSHVRAVPASCIQLVETDPEDYEKETGYLEQIYGQIEPKPWKSKRTAQTRRRGKPDPAMLHYAINLVVGATRGESDLSPVLPWVSRYGDWLRGRFRLNKLRADLAAVDIEIDDDAKVQAKRAQYEADPPTGGNMFVHGRGEKLSYPTANIQAADAEPDGKALRLAVATGSNLPLHFLGEGDTANRATALEMGDPTHRHYKMRQSDFGGFLVDLCECAYRRYEAVLGLRQTKDLKISVNLPEISKANMTEMAQAASTIVSAFAVMKAQGWITDELAIRLSFKFAGEILSEEQIEDILAMAEEEEPEPEEPPAGEPGGKGEEEREEDEDEGKEEKEPAGDE